MATLEMLGEAIRRKKGVINKVDRILTHLSRSLILFSANLAKNGFHFPNYLNLFSAGYHLWRRKQPYNKLYYQGKFVTFQFNICLDNIS
jgi:hypothetical protein